MEFWKSDETPKIHICEREPNMHVWLRMNLKASLCSHLKTGMDTAHSVLLKIMNIFNNNIQIVESSVCFFWGWAKFTCDKDNGWYQWWKIQNFWIRCWKVVKVLLWKIDAHLCFCILYYIKGMYSFSYHYWTIYMQERCTFNRLHFNLLWH